MTAENTNKCWPLKKVPLDFSFSKERKKNMFSYSTIKSYSTFQVCTLLSIIYRAADRHIIEMKTGSSLFRMTWLNHTQAILNISEIISPILRIKNVYGNQDTLAYKMV